MTTNHCNPCFMNPLSTCMSNRCTKRGSEQITRSKINTTFFTTISQQLLSITSLHFDLTVPQTYLLELQKQQLSPNVPENSAPFFQQALQSMERYFSISSRETNKDWEKLNTSKRLRQNPLETGSFKTEGRSKTGLRTLNAYMGTRRRKTRKMPRVGRDHWSASVKLRQASWLCFSFLSSSIKNGGEEETSSMTVMAQANPGPCRSLTASLVSPGSSGFFQQLTTAPPTLFICYRRC